MPYAFYSTEKVRELSLSQKVRFLLKDLFSVVRIYTVVSQSVDHEDVVKITKLGIMPRYIGGLGV